MPIYTKLNQTVGPRTIEDFTASTSRVLGARFGSSFALTPLSSTLRSIELNAAEKMGEIVSAEEANEIGEPLGLSFDEDISRPALDLIVERKSKEQERQSLLLRSQGGFVSGVAGFGADLFAQAVDPINLAASFVPVVGQTRYLSWAAKLGKGNARFARGALEGAVGNILVEPIVLVGATQEQADYQMVDSLMNVAFGSLIGGGLHTLGGRIGDAIKGANAKMVAAKSQQERNAIQGAHIADIVEGRNPDVTPAYKVPVEEPEVKPTGVSSLADDAARDADLEATARGRGELGDDLPARDPLPGILEEDDLAARDADFEAQARADEATQPPLTPDEIKAIYARQDDPANQRLGDADAAERTAVAVKNAPDHTQPSIQERLLGEEQAILDAEVKAIKESELGDDLLEASGVQAGKEGSVSTAAIRDAQKSIDTAKVEVRAVDALADCVGRG